LGVADRLGPRRDRQDRRVAEFSRNRTETAMRRRQWVFPDAAPAYEHDVIDQAGNDASGRGFDSLMRENDPMAVEFHH